MTETKQFHIGDILSITTGRLVSPDHIGGVYNILNWMTGDSLFTHQLPRASDECAPTLREAFPDLAAIEPPEFDGKESVERWLAETVAQYGEYREVPRVDLADHARIDPLLELQHMVGADRVIQVAVPNA